MTDIEFPSGFAHETAPDLTRKVMLDAAEYTTLDDLAALLATSGDLADAIDDKLAIAGHTANALLVADGSGAVVDAASLTSAQHGSQTATTHHATATNALNGFASSAHIATLEALAANAPLVEQIVSTSSATIADTTTLVRVKFGGAVTLKVNARAAGTSCVIRKETTNSGTITVDSDTGLAMNGGTVNASFVLPGSGQGGTNPKTDGEWLLSFVSSSDVRITARVYIDCIPRTGHPAGSILVADGSGAYADVYVTTAAMLPTVAAHAILTRSANSTGQAAAQSVGTDEGLFNVAGVLTSQKVKLENIDSTIAAATTGGAGLMTATHVTNQNSLVQSYDPLIAFPSYQTIQTISGVCHFINVGTTNIDPFTAATNSGAIGGGTLVAGRVGVAYVNTSTSASAAPVIGNNTGSNIPLGAGLARFRADIVLATASDGTDTYTVRFGFNDCGITSPSDAQDGAFFRYTHSVNGGRWECVTRNNNVETATDSGVAGISASYQCLAIEVNAAGTSVAFRINGTLVATNTTNIPTGASRSTGVTAHIVKSAGTTARGFDIDLMAFHCESSVAI